MPIVSTIGGASARGFGAFRAASAASYIVATGGTITTSGNYKIHEFTSSGTFTVTSAPAGATVEAMLVGGGGGGRYGGGGAGGYVYNSALAVSVGSFAVTVGAGGSDGANGSNSVFSTIIALGGGGATRSGGSGGGGVDGVGGVALQPSSASGGLGFAGGDWESNGNDGGGGGAGGAGGVPTGGAGVTAGIANSSGVFDTVAAGGPGNRDSESTAYTPAANSGGGGTGGGYNAIDFGAGAAGVVRIRYRFQ